MMTLSLRFLVCILLVLGSLPGGGRLSPVKKPAAPVIMDFNTRLLPGELHGWIVRPSQSAGGYIVEVTPIQKPKPGEGNYVQTALVRPEFDGNRWNDVLRVQLPEGSAALKVNIRVYETSRLPVLSAFETVLEPGVWHGFGLGDAGERRGYVAEVTPLEPGREGDVIEKIHCQPEYPGEWIDVLRLQIPESQPPLKVQVRVYEPSRLPVVMDFDTTLQPGDWQGYVVQPADARAGYVVEVSPLDDYDAAAEIALVQPEFDGKTWNDVLRVMTYSDRPPLRVNVRVYAVSPPQAAKNRLP